MLSHPRAESLCPIANQRGLTYDSLGDCSSSPQVRFLGRITASGWYATLNETLDKSTTPPKLTRAGRVVFVCLIASSVVALLSQAFETKSTVDRLKQDKQDKEAANAEESQRRQEQLDRLDKINRRADEASHNSETSAKQSGVAVNRLAKVIDDEELAKENTWRAQRPFGSWEAEVRITNIPITDLELPSIAKFLKESQRKRDPHYDENTIQITRQYDDKPEERREGINADYGLAGPLDIFFVPSEPGAKRFARGKPDFRNASYFQLLFYPKLLTMSVQCDEAMKPVSVLELAISYTGFQRKVTPEISNWMDLYGVSMEAVITNLASYGHLQLLKLGYIDTTGMEYRILVLCDSD